MNPLKYISLIIICILFSVTKSNSQEVQLTSHGFTIELKKETLRFYSRLSEDQNPEIALFEFAVPRRENQPTISLKSDCPITLPTLEYLGLRRGVHVWTAIISKKNIRSYLQCSEIVYSLEYGEDITSKAPIRLSVQQKTHFADLVNYDHVPKFLLKNYKEMNHGLLSEKQWLLPDSQYVKVTTSRDGVAFVKGEQLLQLQPSWNGISLEHIHLLFDGKKYAYAEINDDDNILDNNDTLAFIGQRTVGDSTWHDLVTDQRAFFFMKNRAQPSQRLVWNTETTYEGTIEEVEQDFHIEKNNWFHYGDIDGTEGAWFTELRFGKGFYWKDDITGQPWDLLNGVQKPLFAPMVLPRPVGECSVNMTARLSIGNNVTILDHPVRLTINGIIADSTVQQTQGKTEVNTRNTSLLTPGINSLGVHSDVSVNKGLRLLVDYFHVKGKFAPEAIAGSLVRGVVNTEQKKYLIEIPGFRDRKSFLLDNVSNTITRGTAVQGVKYSLTALNNNGYGAISLQDSMLYYGLEKGWTLAVAYPNNTYKIITNDEQKGLDELQNLPVNSIIAFIAANTNTITTTLRQSLNNNGLTVSQNTASYVGIIQKGNGQSLKENVGENSTLHGFLSAAGYNGFKTQFILSQPQIMYAADVTSMEQVKIYPVSTDNLFADTQQSETVIITHPLFFDQAKRLAAFRKQQGHNINVVSVEDIYNQFGYGKKSPHVIKSFLHYAYASWKQSLLSKVLFFGNASWDPLKLLPSSTQIDYVPTYGVPVSDFWYGLLEGDDTQPELVIGRLTPSTQKDAVNIVDKLIEYDTMSVQPWMRNFGAFAEQNPNEDFTFMFGSVEEFVYTEPIGGNVIAHSSSSIEDRPQILRDAINNGLIWLNYSGHGSTLYFGLDGWQAENINNVGKYFFLGTHSCQTGAFADPVTETRNESYVNSEKKGAIAATGDSGWGYTDIAMIMMYNAYSGFASDSLRQLGDLTYRAKIKFGGPYKFAALQYSLIGDPLTRLRFDTKPDLFLQRNDVVLNSKKISTDLSEEDSTVEFSVIIHNAGIVTSKKVKVRFIHTFNTSSDTLFSEIPSVWSYEKRNFTIPIKNKAGIHNYTISVNYDSSITENVYKNNIITGSFTVFSQNATAFDPQTFWTLNGKKPEFRLLARSQNNNTQFELKLLTKKQELIDDTVLNNSVFSRDGKSLFIDWNPNITLKNDSLYYLHFRTVNAITQKNSAWTTIPFFAKDEIQNVQWHYNAEMDGYVELTNMSKKSGKDTYLGLNEKQSRWKVASSGAGAGFRFGQVFIEGEGLVSKPDLVQCVVAHKSKFDSLIKIRFFDTYYGSTENGASNNRNFYRYIMDSIPKGDIVGVTFANSGLRGFYRIRDLGLVQEISLDSLREAMKSLGSVFIDSTLSAKYYPDGREFSDGDRWTSSFAIIGEKGAAKAYDEMYGAPTDTVYADFNKVVTYLASGTLITPFIGESGQWDTLSIYGDNLNGQMKVNIYGFSENNTSLGIIKQDTSHEISLRDINASTVQRIKIEILLERKSEENSPKIYDIRTSYVPIPELAIIPATVQISPDSVLRGDTVTFVSQIINLSKRVSSDSGEIVMTYIPRTASGVQKQFIQKIPPLQTDEIYTTTLKTETASFGNLTSVEAFVRQLKSTEFMYVFNNTAQTLFKVGEDNVPPYLEVYADSMRVTDGDYVLSNPRLDFVVYDNSRLPIDSSRMLVRINGRLFPIANKIENAYYKYHVNEGDKRGTLSFTIKDVFEVGDNNIRVIIEDASANKDTVALKLWVASDNSISNISAYPNPSQGAIAIDFTIRTSENTIPYTMTLFDAEGRIIRRMADVGSLGKNTLMFDGKDEQSHDIPSGMYSYRIQFYGMTATEPILGNFVIVR